MDRPRCRWVWAPPTAGPMRRRRVASCDGSPSVTRTPWLRASPSTSQLADLLLTVDRTSANSSGLLRSNLLHVSQVNLGFSEDSLLPQLHSLNRLINRPHKRGVGAVADGKSRRNLRGRRPDRSPASNFRLALLATQSCCVKTIGAN